MNKQELDLRRRGDGRSAQGQGRRAAGRGVRRHRAGAAQTARTCVWSASAPSATSKRKAGTGRNPRTGEEIEIPASTTVRFKAGKT